MKKYIGTKEVKAQPMTAALAASKGYRVGVHVNEDGYEVEYEGGYKSWSPKDVFEKSYKCSDTFLDRLIIEQHELEDKTIKLYNFLFSDKPNNLDELNRALLECQLDAMKTYNNILSKRISILSKV